MSVFIPRKNFDASQIADSGQCFRFRRSPDRTRDDRFSVCAGARRLMLTETGGGYSADCGREEFDAFWKDYFDLDTDYSAYIGAIDKNDGYLLEAAARGEGIRILRQDPFETLISFILSQRKNIPAIMASVEALCAAFGEEKDGWNAFPSPEALASASLEELRACSLGYRAPYILDTAQAVASGSLDLGALGTLDDDALSEALMKAHGVGPKVASCVSLFAYHRLGAFPRDVWINRIVDEQYGGNFPLELYDGFAGVIQQYIFFAARTGT